MARAAPGGEVAVASPEEPVEHDAPHPATIESDPDEDWSKGSWPWEKEES